MKRVNVIILALVFVSLFGMSSCGDDFDQIEVKEPANKMANDAEQRHKGEF